MNRYEQIALAELRRWQFEMQRPPGFFNRLSKKTQDKINALIPDKIHKGITVVIRQMIRAVLFGAKHTTAKPLKEAAFILREQTVKEKIKFYRNTAAVEGGVTGAGGLLMGLADFPLLLALKLKLLYEIASLYGIDLEDYRERVYLLHIFELAFSSAQHRNAVYRKMEDWDTKMKEMPVAVADFDWRRFQQEYRDYIDLAKMAQLLPVIGAPVGFIANYGLVKKLGITAMNAYRMRILSGGIV
ncbi:EcsC family protein [Niabella sp.]|uniref:EcsC family protein n=1 Tax=Niabella sp. TaxID=1962976 RepID=UPI00260347AA|nr:EcsC family protein [Niabella sp.]